MRTSTFLLTALLLLACVACGSDDSAGAEAEADPTVAAVDPTVGATTPSAATEPDETPAAETPADEPPPTTEAPTEATVAEPLDAIELEPTGEAICDVVATLDFSAVNDAPDAQIQPGDGSCLWLPSDGRTIDFGSWLSDPAYGTGETLLNESTPGDPSTEITQLTSLGRPALGASNDRTTGVYVLLNDDFVLMVETFEDYTVDELTGLAAQFLAATNG